MSLISKTTYCFHCHSRGFPPAVWICPDGDQYSAFFRSRCSSCGAEKSGYSDAYGNAEYNYYRPDGSRIPYTFERPSERV